MDAIYVLYMHTRASDGGIFYIGIGDIKRPFKRSNRTKFWKHIVNKHGYNIQIIAENLTWENACDLEKKYIAFYGRRNKNQGCLVNLTDGGDGVCGIIHSEEARKKISESGKGRISWIKGKKLSEEARKKLSEANKGKKHSEETRKKMSEVQKICWIKRKKHSEEAGKGRIPWIKGKKHSEEARKKMSEAMKARKLSEETRKKMSEAMKGNQYAKGIKHSEESRKKRSEANKGKKHSEESRKKMSEVQKICWIKRKQSQNQLPLINFNYANA